MARADFNGVVYEQKCAACRTTEPNLWMLCDVHKVVICYNCTKSKPHIGCHSYLIKAGMTESQLDLALKRLNNR